MENSGQYFDDNNEDDSSECVDFLGNNRISSERNDNDSLDAIEMIDPDNDVVCVVVFELIFSLIFYVS